MKLKLDQNTITFGKYKDCKLSQVLRDRVYCNWIIQQEWFEKNYTYLYNRIKNYDPHNFFFINIDNGNFIETFQYFNLVPIDQIKLELTDKDKICYKYYLRVMKELKGRICQRLENEYENPYNIKAPTSWLIRFEEEYNLTRKDFKEFITAFDLLNITSVIELIKKEGDIEYKGAKSFIIAKSRSETQERWWEKILKKRYGEKIGIQFKYKSCIFDFINITTKTIFECKLGLKDFDEKQHNKYKIALDEYRIIYLISQDCVIDMENKKLYTNNEGKYKCYIDNIIYMKNPSYLDDIIMSKFEIEYISDLETLFGK